MQDLVYSLLFIAICFGMFGLAATAFAHLGISELENFKNQSLKF
jgi:hypothetical protein